MNQADKLLLIRVARRMEERADADWRVVATASNDLKVLDAAKRRRDRELGDAKDLREYMKRVEAEQAAKATP